MVNCVILAIGLFVRIILVHSAGNQYYTSRRFNHDVVLSITDFIEIYEDARRNETTFEENMWTGAKLVLNEKTNEVKANEIFMKYKLEELSEYRNVTSENPAAMYYYDAKDKIEKSKVYQIIKKMPKGANLYIHSWGSVSSEWVANNFSKADGFKVCIFETMNTYSFRNKHRSCQNADSLLKSNKTCNETFYSNFDLGKWRSIDEYYEYGDPWKIMWEMFIAISDAVFYKPMYEKFHYQMLQEMYDDNIMYAEVRTEFLELYDTNQNYTREETVQTLIDVVKNFKKTHKDFLGIKFIYSIMRYDSVKEVQKEIEIFKGLQKMFPKHIIGLDLVGWEDYGTPLKRYLEDFIKLKNEDYKFYFHAGETNRYGRASDYNLYDALLLQSKRIGHGYALWKHPVIMNEVMSQSIPIEICPVSNQVIKLVADLRNHPGGIYLSEDAPLVVGNDAPGFLSTTGLSTDLYYTIMSLASNKADLRTLKQLALNSLTYSTLSKTRLAKARELFTEKWNKFLNEIVEDKI